MRKTSRSTSAGVPSSPSPPGRVMTMGPARPACVLPTMSAVERYIQKRDEWPLLAGPADSGTRHLWGRRGGGAGQALPTRAAAALAP